MDFDHVKTEFLNSIPDSKARTRQTYATAMASFGRFLSEANNAVTPDTPLAEYPERIILDFSLWLDKLGYSAFTQSTYLAGLRRFLWFHDLARRLSPEFNMGRAAKMLGRRKLNYPQSRTPDNLPELVLFYDQLELPEPDGSKGRQRRRLCLLRDRAVMHALFDSAGRVSEVAALTRQDVDDGELGEVIITGKGDKERWLYLTADTLALLRDYLAERNDAALGLFVSHGRDAGTRLNRTTLWRIVKHAAQMCNIKDVSPHTFRHWRASQMLNDGVPLETIQEILGHSDIGTTRKVYAKSKRKKVKEAFFQHTPSPQQAALVAQEEMAGNV